MSNLWIKKYTAVCILLLLSLIVGGCGSDRQEIPPSPQARPIPEQPPLEEPEPPVPGPDNEKGFYGFDNPRPNYMPGELVDYIAQSGDILSALAARFHTSEEEIRLANPQIPPDATTFPAGFPMKIPIYYRSQWGSSFPILSDALFVNSPAQIGFSARGFTDRQPGWFKYFTAYTGKENRRGGEMVEYIAKDYSLSPRLLLAILEYKTGALTNPRRPENIDAGAALGFVGDNCLPLSSQLNELADYLNDMYYSYREGNLLEFELEDGSLFRIDPWQNAATAALQRYFADTETTDGFYRAISPEGFRKTYEQLFGQVFPEQSENIPGSLRQPEMLLPFAEGKSWALTGGPHPAWGSGASYAAIDFAPPSESSGCVYSAEWVLAPAGGIIVRKETGVAILDLDGDGDERTGWNILFLHLLTDSIPPAGTVVNTGDPLGHPSCDGGTSTGTHVHIARKYNGEWISAGGVIPIVMDGWTVENGTQPYLGQMRRFSVTARACDCSDYRSLVHNGPPLVPTSTPTAAPKR